MEKINVGVLGPSETAFKYFVPAILSHDKYKYIGVACANTSELSNKMLEDEFYIKVENIRAMEFQEEYGGKIFYSYNSLLTSEIIDAVYISLPPEIYFKWAMRAIVKGKHVMLEKPYITLISDTWKLIEAAKEKVIAFHESYASIYKGQKNKSEQYKSAVEHLYQRIMDSKTKNCRYAAKKA
jgi:dTDP-3,4-didehydro-2,6-dideoxy-alpha-D-glucose 3-reductase